MNDPRDSADDAVVRAIEDKAAVGQMMTLAWGSPRMVVGMFTYDVTQIDATGLFGPEGELYAVASWTTRGKTAYICALSAFTAGKGHARRLLKEVNILAKARGCKTIRAMVTNDNMPGFVFYQKNGFRFASLYVGAVDAYRPQNPGMITHGHQGIEVHDAFELELEL